MRFLSLSEKKKKKINTRCEKEIKFHEFWNNPYKVWQNNITMCGMYCKVWQLLQSYT